MAEHVRNNHAEIPDSLSCEQWESLLADRIDGTLAPEAETAFIQHGSSCPSCAGLLEQARQGQEWLKLLGERAPAAPVDMLSRILARTQGAGHEADYPAGTNALAGIIGAAESRRWGIPVHPGVFAVRGAQHARMLMTGAMAFFSVALTLSVAGVRLNAVHAAELRPQAVESNVSRSFYGTKKQVVSFYENLRLVYEVESKMHDMRYDKEEPAPRQPAATTGTQPPPKVAPRPHGSASGPATIVDHPEKSESGGKRPEQGEQVEHGWPVSVSLEGSTGSFSGSGPEQAAGTRRGSIPANRLTGAMSKKRICI